MVDLLLSILIPSIPEKITYMARIASELTRQSQNLPVEVLVFIDNRQRTVGAKRNALVAQAQGRYVAFVDDDDRVASDYVESLLGAIAATPEASCIVFDVDVNLSGLGTKTTKFDRSYIHSEDDNYYYRKPNHVMCYDRNIALKHPFLDVSYGEDDEWAARASLEITNQVRIDKTLYYYDYTFKRPTNNPQLRNWEDFLMISELDKDNNTLN